MTWKKIHNQTNATPQTRENVTRKFKINLKKIKIGDQNWIRFLFLSAEKRGSFMENYLWTVKGKFFVCFTNVLLIQIDFFPFVPFWWQYLKERKYIHDFISWIIFGDAIFDIFLEKTFVSLWQHSLRLD